MKTELRGQQLLWQPLHAVLRERFASGDRLSFVVCPFIKADALEELMTEGSWGAELRIIVRWRAEDLLSGVSDLAVYPFLKSRGVPLYVSSRLHMKLYVCDSNWALGTSANLTQRGLGLGPQDRWNIESGQALMLTRSDWIVLHQLIQESRLVDDVVYARLQEYVAQHRALNVIAPPMDVFGPRKIFTLASLPATDSPAQLEEFYFSGAEAAFAPNLARRAFQDLATYRIRPGLTREAFRVELRAAFEQSPFVNAFIAHLATAGSLRFGAVADWIHDHCEDVPLPYRRDVKEQVRILYDWLVIFVPRTHWDRPHHSQVLYWMPERRQRS
jgi:hypothetical protein